MGTDYSGEKQAAQAVDEELGFAIDATEALIRDRLSATPNKASQTWNHLSPQIFQTPYAELERIVAEADPENTARAWADLGCAYGRLGIVLARLRPDARFLGFEIASERVTEAKRVFAQLGLTNSELVCADLSQIPLPKADLYFIYDFGTREEIAGVLEKLKEAAKTRLVRVVGRGRGIRDAIEQGHPWLASVHAPLHTPHYSIYRSS